MKKIQKYLKFIDSRGPDLVEQEDIIEDIVLSTKPGVWSPSKGKSTKMFLEVLRNYPLTGVFSVLDIGTGTGILALYLYKKGITNITVTDYMEEALDNVKKNVEVNRANEIKIKKSDLFSDITGKFDLILFNAPATHPLRKNIPKILEPLWSPEENIRLRFLQSLPNFLTPGGSALLMYSIFEDYNPIPRTELEKFPFIYKILKTSKGEMSESGVLEIKLKK